MSWGAAPPAVPEAQDAEENVFEPEPEVYEDDTPLAEVAVTLREGGVSPLAAESLLLALGSASFPIAFEIVGEPEAITIRFACRTPDEALLRHQTRAFFPDAVLLRSGSLREIWEASPGEGLVLELGLAREFMVPLRTFREFRLDPLTPVLGALSDVREGEVALLQVLFTPAISPWAESVIAAVHDGRGEPFFLDAPEISQFAREKVARPLAAVVLRAAARSLEEERRWTMVQNLAGALALMDGENELVPLAWSEKIDLEADLLARTTHRTGMLLSVSELAALVHLPHESIRLAKLKREVRRTKAPPPVASGDGVTVGVNAHEGETVAARLPRDLRMRHVHVIGASGSGKSTLLIQMILGDLARGEGVGVIDPHGDLVDEILARFPEEREEDLILFDPGDEEVALGWNMLEARSETEKTLLASDLVGVFRRLSTSWGDQMNSVLANAILAFLESETGGTLLDLRRFLVDRDFREAFLATVQDPEVRFYFEREFPLLKGLPQAPILTRLDTFLRPKPVRRVVVEREHRLDVREMVDGGKVFLAKLAQGAIGEENAALLGSLLVSAFHQAAMSRADLAPHARRHFFLYLDEFHELATPSMAALLTGARKYRLGLTLAHQELRQLESRNRDLASAVLANAATRIVFRVGEEDARALERGFMSFAASDLQNLGVGEAIVRVERADHDFNVKTEPLPDLAPEEAEARRAELVALTRATFPRRKEVAREEPAPPPAPTPEPIREAPRTEIHRDEPEAKRAAAQRPRVSPPPAPLGRGGPEHKYLQEFVKRSAESRGFRAVVEEKTPDGAGQVDVSLEGHGLRIACEISVASTPEQEAGNVEKCLAGGFDRVAVLSAKKGHLDRVEKAVRGRIVGPDIARVSFLAPEELLSFLDDLAAPEPAEKIVGGYRVKVNYKRLDKDEEARRSKRIAEVVARSIHRLRRD